VVATAVVYAPLSSDLAAAPSRWPSAASVITAGTRTRMPWGAARAHQQVLIPAVRQHLDAGGRAEKRENH
jgi:hypothetical protein